jgi:predicted RNA-binding Zn-ribbon protein involved in translation (DUF1610 family)
MACECAKYTPIDLMRRAITQRIKETPALKKRLVLLAKNEKLRIHLYRCPTCGQYWQTGHEWNFADKEYLFHVPHVELDVWSIEPYAQPAAMLIYSAVLQDYMARNKFESSESTCASPDCGDTAIRMSTFCLKHHIGSLQRARLLPPPPKGRMFPPYC